MQPYHVVPHESLDIKAMRCGPEDLEPMLDRLETLLHEDYFFRRKHFAAILARPAAAVFAILVEGDFSAIAIVYNGSTLTNLYVHPEHRRLGIGTAVLAWLRPETIRAKGNMSQGNPIPFYAANGYVATGADAKKPHIIVMEKLETNGKPPISAEKKAHLDRIRAKSLATRREKKAHADYERLVNAGIEERKARMLAWGAMPGEEQATVPAGTPQAYAQPPAPPAPVSEPSGATWPFAE